MAAGPQWMVSKHGAWMVWFSINPGWVSIEPPKHSQDHLPLLGCHAKIWIATELARGSGTWQLFGGEVTGSIFRIQDREDRVQRVVLNTGDLLTMEAVELLLGGLVGLQWLQSNLYVRLVHHVTGTLEPAVGLQSSVAIKPLRWLGTGDVSEALSTSRPSWRR